MCSVSAGTASSKSHLFMAMRCGMFFAFRRASKSVCASVSPSDASTTTTAKSHLFITCMAFRTRWAPSAPMSSRPGVSIITTGPSGSNSIALETGSVVVPAMSETMARSCPVIALMRLDFPALRLPKMPICTRSALGAVFMLIQSPQIQNHSPSAGNGGSMYLDIVYRTNIIS